MMGWGAGGWIMMGFGMVLFWGLVILGIVWIVRTLARAEHREPEHRSSAENRSPVETLDRSLAEGKIDVDDYRERRRVLTGST
jgi:putative membrane protein